MLARFGPAKLEGSDAEKISAIEARKTCTHEQAAMRRQVLGSMPAAVLDAKVFRADRYEPRLLLQECHLARIGALRRQVEEAGEESGMRASACKLRIHTLRCRLTRAK